MSNGTSTILEDAAEGNIPALRQALERGEDPNAGRDTYNRAPLHEAAWNGRVDAVKVLLEFNADTDVQNIEESTPLHFAAANGHVRVVKELLEAGANPNAKNQGGYTPLHYASKQGDVKVVEKLISYDASLKEENNDGETPRAVVNPERAAELEAVFARAVELRFKRKQKQGRRNAAKKKQGSCKQQ